MTIWLSASKYHHNIIPSTTSKGKRLGWNRKPFWHTSWIIQFYKYNLTSPQLPAIENGNWYRVKDRNIALLRCTEGYHSTGASELGCGPDGSWEDEPGTTHTGEMFMFRLDPLVWGPSGLRTLYKTHNFCPIFCQAIYNHIDFCDKRQCDHSLTTYWTLLGWAGYIEGFYKYIYTTQLTAFQNLFNNAY